jgi:hypothetical protein
LTGCACLGQAKSCNNAKGRTIWIVDAHRDDGKRYVVRADEKLTAFLKLESPTGTAANYLDKLP